MDAYLPVLVWTRHSGTASSVQLFGAVSSSVETPVTIPHIVSRKSEMWGDTPPAVRLFRYHEPAPGVPSLMRKASNEASAVNRRIPSLLIVSLVLSGSCLCDDLPVPKEGLLVPRARVETVRRQLQLLVEHPVMTGKRGIGTVADQAVADWPQTKSAIEPYVTELLDVESDRNPPGMVSEEAREAARKLGRLLNATAKLGFLYFLSGEPRYARTAYEILDTAGRVPRWGWFNWDGVHVPQIPFGMYTRNAAFAADFCWDGWSESRRERVLRILAHRSVETYWRLVSLSPFMGLHHLRSKNQGSNVLSAALIASLVVGDSVPENALWFDSLLQTYVWILAHDIGPAGTHLESGLPGYWSVSMQNLYTAAACLNNARGLDLRVHPAIAEATWYPIMKEATVPPCPHGRFDQPYPKDRIGLSGTMEHKPIELPSPSYGGSWWYDYASAFPESPATYFIAKDFQGRIANAHQEGHSRILELLWVHTMDRPESIPEPRRLFKTTEREAMFRSGYGSPHTFLSFNGDMFLSARNEVLCCTSGLAWHFPWHQYAVTESVLETEGELFSPSMVITDSFDSRFVSMIEACSGPSNVKYYPRPGQVISHRAYTERTRSIAYVRSGSPDRIHDYFVFIDRVEHEAPRWHSFNWHIWSQPGNEGRYEVRDPVTVVARRPNAAVLLRTLSHSHMTWEEQAIPSQPTVAYVFDHNALLLRGIAGKSDDADSEPLVLPARLWSDCTPSTVNGRSAVRFEDFSEPEKKKPSLRTPIRLEPGCRYRVSVDTRKEAARIYENFSWIITLRLLDEEGSVLVDAGTAPSYRDPHPLKLTSPASNEASYSDWRETTTHFTAPEGVVMLEATLLPATYGHGTHLTAASKIWLSDMTFTCLGRPQRSHGDLLVTLAVPMENDDPLPGITSARREGRVEGTIVHPDGTRDRIIVHDGGGVQIQRTEEEARLAFGWKTKGLEVGGLSAESPIHATLVERANAVEGQVATNRRTSINLRGRPYDLTPGTYSFDGNLHRSAASALLTTNPPESQGLLKAGLSPIAGKLLEERDACTRRGWRNLARDAVEVRATAQRDERFAARHVIDGKTWEIPIDGVVDYTLGNVTTTGNGGYGRGAASYGENLSTWPLYFRPTYWLLPPRTTGSVTITLKEPAPLKLIRLLNTTNAGLNDYAAVRCRVELLSRREEIVWTRELTFGSPWDRPFKASFAFPEFFDSYGDSFKGILEPGVPVPFPATWQDLAVDVDHKVQHVRVHVESFWALGGGLNEIQVYGR